MLKRRDWSLFQGQDGSGSEGESSDEEVGSEPENSDQEDSAANSGSEDIDEGNDSEGSQDVDEEVGGRLEDISEDDFEAKDLDEEAKTLKEQWLSGKKLSEEQLKAALACRLCKGVLLISPAALRNHVQSKRHLNKQKKKGDDYEAICLAKQLKNDNLETHQERLERLRKMSSGNDQTTKPVAGQVKSKRSVRRALMKARKQAAKQAEGSEEQPKKGKPGKRQREALKEDKQDSKPAKAKKRQKLSKTDDTPTDQQENEGQLVPGRDSKISESPAEKHKGKGKNRAGDLRKPREDQAAGKGLKKEKKKKREKNEKASAASKANRAERRAVKQARIKAAKV